MDKDQSSLLDELKQSGVSTLKISKETGIPSDRMYKWYEGKGNPKFEDVQKLRAWLDKRVEKVPHGTKLESDPLTALIESNRDLAESNKILAQSHADLVLLMRQSTAGESAEKLKADVSMFGAILEHLAKIGVRAGEWKSVDEALRAVGRTANDKNKGVQKVRS